MKYKYKVGQKVKYNTQKYTEKVCPTCGHEETDSKTIKATGIITKRYYDLVYRFQNFPLADKVEILEDGSKVHNPYLSDIRVNKPEPCYDIIRRNGNNEIKTEDEIIEIIN